jgi:hypothetical protein
MTSTKSIKWNLASGKAVEVKIEVTREMTDDVAYADGWNVDLGKKLYENTDIKVYIDDKFYENSFEPSVAVEPMWCEDWVKKIADMGGYAIIAHNIVIKKAIYDEIMTAIAEAKAEVSADPEVAEHDAKESLIAAQEAAKIAEIKAVEIPAAAISAYNRYHGNAETAWENEDETAWALINKWSPYIEAQHGTDPVKLQRELAEAARESSFGINEG